MYLSIINNLVQLRFTSQNQATISSTIQDFGHLIDTSREQQSQTTTSQVVPIQQQQQQRFPPPGHPHSNAHYVSTVPNQMHNQGQSYNDHCKSFD
jgi:hypothetical protein